MVIAELAVFWLIFHVAAYDSLLLLGLQVQRLHAKDGKEIDELATLVIVRSPQNLIDCHIHLLG